MNVEFSEIYTDYQKVVRHQLYHLVYPQEIDDLVQEVFVKIFKNLNKLKDQKKIKSWIYQITRRTAFDYYRRKSSNKKKQEALNTSDDKNIELERETKKANLNIDINWALKQLAIEERELILLALYNELKLEEISQILEIPVGTVKSKLFRSKEKLKKLLNNQDKPKIINKLVNKEAQAK